MNKIEIPDRHLKMLTREGFNEIYDEYRAKDKTSNNSDIWEQVEAEHLAIFKRHKYKSYDSFRKVRETAYKRRKR